MLFLSIILLLFAGAILLSCSGRQPTIKAEGKRLLTDCPDTPNCVYSQATRSHQKIGSIDIQPATAQQSWDKLVDIVKQQGGEILVDDGNYCHAVFTSMIFRFKDDLELKLGQSQIDIRSASRVGKSDFGVNRKRVEKIKAIYNSGTNAGS